MICQRLVGTLRSKLRTIKFVIGFGGQLWQKMLQNTFVIACPVNIGKHPIVPRSYQLGIDLSRSFQCVAIDLVEYKASAEGYHYVMSVIDHRTRFVILIPLKRQMYVYRI